LLLLLASMLPQATQAADSCSKREMRARSTDTIRIEGWLGGVRVEPERSIRPTTIKRVFFSTRWADGYKYCDDKSRGFLEVVETIYD
jgi:hypothetical protein